MTAKYKQIQVNMLQMNAQKDATDKPSFSTTCSEAHHLKTSIMICHRNQR